jgi:hypothetical protein
MYSKYIRCKDKYSIVEFKGGFIYQQDNKDGSSTITYVSDADLSELELGEYPNAFTAQNAMDAITDFLSAADGPRVFQMP